MINPVILKLQDLCGIRQNKFEIEINKLKQKEKDLKLRKNKSEQELLELEEKPAIFKNNFYKNLLGKTITPFELKKLDIELSKIKQKIDNQKQDIKNLLNQLDSIKNDIKEFEKKLKQEIIKNEKYKYINLGKNYFK
jgi:chromosome segregation ATPase